MCETVGPYTHFQIIGSVNSTTRYLGIKIHRGMCIIYEYL